LFGVLATRGAGGLHTTIVSIAPADDLHTILFATPRETRKYQNLQQDHDVSLFIDDRTNSAEAITSICGVEARGSAMELSGEDRHLYERIYRRRHPNLDRFVGDAALFRIDVDRYDIVNQFQNVYVLDIEQPEDQL
jgi:uncharacterized protein YhbP (UPF0306 family)